MKKSRIAGAALAAIALLAAASTPHATPLADAFTLTVYEQTGSINSYTFQSTDPLLYVKRTGYPGPVNWGGNGYDFGTGGCEYYDLFFSDSLGNVLALSPGDELPAPAYLTLICMDLNCNDGSITPAPTWEGAGNSIDAVKIVCSGATYWANGVLQAVYGLCDEPFSAKTSNFADEALGPQNGGITKMGCGPSMLTLRFTPPAPAPPDTIPPMLTGVTTTSASSIALIFDEKLGAAPAAIPSNYVLFETDHPSNTIGISSATLTGDGSRVQLVLSANLVSGRSYTISVSNLVDLKGNVIPPGTSLVFVFVDAVPPALLSAHAAVSTAVLASFSERLDNVTAENAGNYLVFETADPADTVPISGASLSEDSSNVILDLGSALADGVAYSLKATGVADRAGNPVPAGSVVPITRPDTTPPHLSAAEAVTLTYVRVTFDEPVTAATAGLAANYVLVPAANPGLTFSPSSVDLPDGRTAGLLFVASLGSGAVYAVRVSNVADPAGNVIAPGSEKTFVCPSIPSDSGDIGLFVDAGHSDVTVDFASGSELFNVYVWSHPGIAGMVAAEFSVAFPSNVIFSGYAMNPLVAVSLGDITQDLSVAYSECQHEWTWILKADCYLMNDDKTVIGFAPDPIFANCSAGYPIESANVLGRIYCNGGVATLLQEFAASCVGGAVEVTWRLRQIDEGIRFAVLRKEAGAAAYGAPSDEIEANGLSFVHRDESAEPGKAYRYRIEYVNVSGVHVLFETDLVAVPALPLALHQNTPNPFNPSTTIRYYLPERMRVVLAVYDVSGRLVARLVDEEQSPGEKAVRWDGRNTRGERVSSGVYYCRLQAGKELVSRAMVLLR